VSRPERLATFDYVGLYRYSITICTLEKQKLFTDSGTVEPARSHFLQQAAPFACAVVVYCFMPDHLHLLIEGTTDDAALEPFIAKAKQKSGFDFAARAGRRLWQKGYYDRVLRDEESTVDVIRYIINNPVRAGLVKDPAEYAFWGSGVYSREELIDLIALERHR